ncbi:MAG: HDOD domain-containing protein [Desulfobacterales bacterium]|nr:HDOD domain-containing protein [Desulfobacterales bacterium]
MKILVVDDENISRKILVSKMKALGTCVAVDNSKKALAEMELADNKEDPFDIITLDVSMPGMDGRQMLKHIRTREIKNKVPKEERVKILMVTARMNMNTIKSCIKMGCNGYLTKPVSRFQLLQNLGKMGFDTKEALEKEGNGATHTTAVADIINRFYTGKIALPVFPHIVQEVQDLFSSKDPSIEDLGKIVEKDIVISSKLISIANSPLYKGMDTVSSLNAALLRLGLKTARGVISAVAARNLFSSANKILKKELDRLWLHSFATASLGKQLGEALGHKKADNLFLMGIIHDIGKMLLMKAFVDIHPDKSVADPELRLAIHEIHTTFGAVLLKKMRFSSPFVQAAEFHHWNTYDKDTDQELLILCLADHLAYETGYGFLGAEGQRLQEKAGDKPKEDAGEDQETDRDEALERIKNLSALKLLGMTPEAVYAIGEQIQPMIKESAGAF